MIPNFIHANVHLRDRSRPNKEMQIYHRHGNIVQFVCIFRNYFIKSTVLITFMDYIYRLYLYFDSFSGIVILP